MCVCVCEHLWLQRVGLHVFNFSVQEKVLVWVKGGTHGVLEVTPNRKTINLQVSVCVYLVFSL